jgi:HK97 family phage major capsid protein
MPDVAEIIARSQATRERIAAQRQARGMDDSPRSLNGRAADAVRRLERAAIGAESDRRMASVRAARPSFLAREDRRGGADDMVRSANRDAFNAYLRKGERAMRAEQIKALQTGNDVGGGFLVPLDFERQLVRNLVQVSQVRQASFIGQTSTDTVRVPKRTSASTAAWVGEVDTAQSTTPSYGAIDVPINDARCYVDVSNSLLEDAAINIEEELAMELAREFARLEGAAFISGTGVKQPTGLLTSPAINYVAGGDAGDIPPDAIVNLPFALPAAYAQNGVWLMCRSTMSAVRKLKDSVNRYLFDENLNKEGLPTIQGRPVYDAPDMPSVAANTFPIIFGDVYSAYRIYDRLQVAIMRDPFTLATQSMTRFHARRRLGAAVVLGEAVVKLKIATS